MSTWQYIGKDRAGRTYKNTVDAENERAARSKLRRQGIFVSKITEHHASSRKNNESFMQSIGGRVGLRDMVTMTRQLATLVKANIPVVEAIKALVDQVSHPRLRVVLSDVRRNVTEGGNLADSLAKYPKVFSQIYVNMVRVGEASGTLDITLTRLAEFSDKDYKLTSKIKGAMTYPIIMVGIATTVMTILLAFVVPKITAIFKDMKKDLPFMTEALIKISEALRDYWLPGTIGLVVGFLFVRWYITTPAGKLRFDRMLLRVPLIKDLSLGMATSRFSQTLSTMLRGGVPLLDAMEIVKKVVDNEVLRKALEDATQEIIEGKSIAAPLEKSGMFPPMVTTMIAIGERTGELEPMLDIVTESFENEVDTRITSLTTALEPLMMVVMGSAVGLIVYAIIMPLLEMSNIQA